MGWLSTSLRNSVTLPSPLPRPTCAPVSPGVRKTFLRTCDNARPGVAAGDAECRSYRVIALQAICSKYYRFIAGPVIISDHERSVNVAFTTFTARFTSTFTATCTAAALVAGVAHADPTVPEPGVACGGSAGVMDGVQTFSPQHEVLECVKASPMFVWQHLDDIQRPAVAWFTYGPAATLNRSDVVEGTRWTGFERGDSCAEEQTHIAEGRRRHRRPPGTTRWTSPWSRHGHHDVARRVHLARGRLRPAAGAGSLPSNTSTRHGARLGCPGPPVRR